MSNLAPSTYTDLQIDIIIHDIVSSLIKQGKTHEWIYERISTQTERAIQEIIDDEQSSI